jgi:hypothetical protein
MVAFRKRKSTTLAILKCIGKIERICARGEAK